MRRDVPLSPLTSLGLGGPARCFAEVGSEPELREALSDASSAGDSLFVLGGGSNIVVGDEGWSGLVVHIGLRGFEVAREADAVTVTVGAGEPWDEVVARAVAQGWAGLECLSGIPGLAGATPIQNVGAYGQEVADTVAEVRVFDRAQGRALALVPADCGFAYRSSIFKGTARYIVLAVRLRLLATGVAKPVRYAELAARLGAREDVPLGRVREAVLGLRREKGMVLDADDPHSHSAGSFFVNPLLDAQGAAALEARARAAGALGAHERLPAFVLGNGQHKVPAGWLIERAGLKGFRQGAVGVSPKHALALVHYGGGSARELLALAAHVRETVRARFGVVLTPEPVLVGAKL